MRVVIRIVAASALLAGGVILGRLSKEPSQSRDAVNERNKERELALMAPSSSPPSQEAGTSSAMRSAGSSEDKESLLTEMEQAATEYDQPNLPLFERGLKHRDPSVRLAACDALIRLSAQDAVPILHAAAERASDPAEATRLEEAAKFLAMPEVTTELDRSTPANATMPKQPLRRMKITPVE